MSKAVALAGALFMGAAAMGAAGCSLARPDEPEAIATAAPTVRTVAPASAATPAPGQQAMPTVSGTPTPPAGDALSTRPIGDEKAAAAAKRAGKDVGPVVNYGGIARADGKRVASVGKNAQGIPIYRHPVGSGFMIVIEGKPGINNVEVGRSNYRYKEDDPTLYPDLQIQVSRPLGDGNPAVCDARKPNLGGIPAVVPPSFAETAKVSAALNDFSCRFETFIESNASCTINQFGDFEFLGGKDSKVQFCMVVARTWAFPSGDTLVTVRLLDTDGNPGPVSRFIIQYKPNPTPQPKPAAAPTPTPQRRRL